MGALSDAKGQRQTISYGNGTATAYTYDPLTFRLARLVTTRVSPAATLQDLSYTYDPIGNITEIVDAAQQTVFFDNTAASPSMAYEYDAVYRLTYAEGREHAGLIGDDQRDERDLPIHALPHANDMSAVRRYEETYTYDAIGNFVSLAHVAVGNSAATWTRRYDYYPGTNRLRSTSLPGDTTAPYSATYPHDAHGNITSMPHLAAIDWDPLDQMQRADLGGGGEVFFTYDAAGQRVRKYRKHIGTLVEERIYLGSFEIYRKRSGSTLQVERETLHVMDGVRRVAMIETKTVDTAVVGLVPTPRYRFQLGNHLETAHLEVDDTGLVISYEEMHPYGTSAYRSANGAVEVSARRYRYTGKERDDETGLDYFGARYYASWLGRWVSADPLGVQAGVNLYLYCRAGPVVLVDPDGRDGVPALRKATPTVTAKAKEVADDTTFVGPRLEDAHPAVASGRVIDSTQGPKLEARSAEALHKDRQEDLAAYKIPPSQLSDEESQGLGVDYKIGFKLATTGRMLEVWATHEPQLYLDSEHNVRESSVHQAHTDLVPELGGYGLYVLPGSAGSLNVPSTAFKGWVAEKLALGADDAFRLTEGAAATELRAAGRGVGGGGTGSGGGGVGAGGGAPGSAPGPASRVLHASNLGELGSQEGTVVLGHYTVPYGPYTQETLPILSEGAAQLGGKTLEALPGNMGAIAPEIQAASRIVFFTSSGMRGLTAEEMLLIQSTPALHGKTTFIYGGF